MRLDTVPFQNPQRISRSAEMRHPFEPTVPRERVLKTRSAFPEEIFLATQIDRLIFRHYSISRQRCPLAISVAALMCELKPINRRAGERFDPRRFLFTQALSTSVHPDAATRQTLPGLHPAGPNNLIGPDVPMIRQRIGFGNPKRRRVFTPSPFTRGLG